MQGTDFANASSALLNPAHARKGATLYIMSTLLLGPGSRNKPLKILNDSSFLHYWQISSCEQVDNINVFASNFINNGPILMSFTPFESS